MKVTNSYVRCTVVIMTSVISFTSLIVEFIGVLRKENVNNYITKGSIFIACY